MVSRKVRARAFAAHMALIAMLCSGGTVQAFSSSGSPDSYSEIEDDELKNTFLEILSADGESSTGKLVLFHESGDADKQVVVHVVQDRGVPRGTQYPTYVFRTVGELEGPDLIFKSHTGTRLYRHDEGVPENGCLLSAENGYSDICLADIQGNAAPDLPGLRKDFWSDLIKLFGL
ncbi:hypothetical protein [Labrenzia sp. DG1229]|uniref:hypothetical protein n=1 Tax=Labrenzia sp. DG1229 TaxID=681847 RepID=UPI000A8E562B|nr:hypothetical protein [Labrenzia sp. DG1229]